MSVRKLGVLAAVATMVVLLLPTAAGAAKPVQCGQVVTSSLKLVADVGPCPDDGLVITKSHVTLDLNGHTVQGAGNPSLDQVGVRVVSVSDVSVVNGVVTGFNAGVAVEASTATTVKRVTARGNLGTGASNHGDGIILDGSTRSRIVENDVSGNGPYGGISLVDEATDNLIRGNDVHDNVAIRTEPVGQPPWNPPPIQQNIGIRLESGSSNNTLERNRIAFNGSHGVSAPGPDHTGIVVRDNLIEGNGGNGIAGPGDDFVLTGNRVLRNGFDQFHLPGASPAAYDGIIVFGNFILGPGVVEANTVDGNAGNGIQVVYPGFSFQGEYHPPVVYQIRGNTVRGNGANGIYVMCDFVADRFPSLVCLEDPPPHVGQQIVGNVTSGNGGAGAGTSAWDLYDQNEGCDHNTWLDNSAVTANPSCTLATSGP